MTSTRRRGLGALLMLGLVVVGLLLAWGAARWLAGETPAPAPEPEPEGDGGVIGRAESAASSLVEDVFQQVREYLLGVG